jgi:hypothetical protein
MFGAMQSREVEPRGVKVVEEEIALVCGELNAAHARLVTLIAEVLDGDLWHGDGLRSAEHWVAWKTGLSPARAAQLTAIARRRAELPVISQAFTDGELAVDQHWEHGGATDTPNLVCLCAHHHRLHHRDQLWITGDADRPDGLSFTSASGVPLPSGPKPRPPTGPPTQPRGRYRHPLGEDLDHACLYFHPPRAA